VVDPLLDEVSETAWYLFADSAQVDTCEAAFLEGSEGPQIVTQAGFDTLGIDYRVTLDFGVGAVDWVGVFRSAGA
jgi:hypothetical protein